MEKSIIIIANSLTNDFISPRPKFQQVQLNVGLREINRLMGEGDRYGFGPLPTYLKAAMAGKQAGKPISLILLRDLHDPEDPIQQQELLRYGDHNLQGTEGAEFVPPIVGLLPKAEVIDTQTLSMPIYAFNRALKEILGKGLLDLTIEDRDRIVFVIVGVYTNILVLSTATMLRNEYGFQHVLVSPHLVGSNNHEVHLSALQIDFPNTLIRVVTGLKEIYASTGVPGLADHLDAYAACRITPREVATGLNRHQRSIIENLFMVHTRVRLQPLGGGYSGSLLFLTQGEKEGVKTVAEIVKVDKHVQMQKELDGYNLVKDLIGQHVPTFGLPVSHGPFTGIKMDLACMSGAPETFQALYESCTESTDSSPFLTTFNDALALLKDNLYQNTLKEKRYYPYRDFALHTEQQQIWLEENIGYILPETDLNANQFVLTEQISIPNFLAHFPTITRHTDRIHGYVSLCHGDLNFANLISDGKGNTWIIDWSHTDEKPVATDFAKLENDLKFILNKGITDADLEVLRRFDEFLLSSMELPPLERLSDEFGFIGDDPGFKQVYSAIKAVRDTYLAVVGRGGDMLYRIALLKYAVHTLSFDQRRGRGECSLPQLKYALLSVCLLVMHLKEDELHRNIRQDKPKDYPARAIVPQAQAPWHLDVPEYKPEYWVDPTVLENDGSKTPGGWADPEDWGQIRGLEERGSFTGEISFDSQGRPLNPAGRRGIQGRGLLGRWGPNYTVDPVLTRQNPVTGELEFLLVQREDIKLWGLPGGVVREGESDTDTAGRALEEKSGLEHDFQSCAVVGQMYVDDYRNTDHAWMETTVLHLHLQPSALRNVQLREGVGIRDAAWVVITPELADCLYANHAKIIKQAAISMLERDEDFGERREVESVILNI